MMVLAEPWIIVVFSSMNGPFRYLLGRSIKEPSLTVFFLVADLRNCSYHQDRKLDSNSRIESLHRLAVSGCFSDLSTLACLSSFAVSFVAFESMRQRNLRV